ncbi:MAG TPA: electron transfer flavoprotein subunit alpha/FixB family protein [Candidatus Bathyarchaeia archaeon]|nr:electron transfer flavoprotein subunit alpha/FixB family protein [Candidatus Bathyarchaeia archaeon]
MTEGDFRHVYIIMEQEEGKLLQVSLEMLAEARRLLDEFNKKYSSKEKVVAVLLGHDIKQLTESLISHGADAVVYSDNPELKHVRNTIYTKVISQIALDKDVSMQIEPEYATQFKKPRYMFFAADSIGRHLSATAMAQLESGLASDINKLVIGDIQMTHQSKTGGKPTTYEKTLEMYRPDFSGFLWTTILCLDNLNPAMAKDFHPQSCSIIPGVFEPLRPDSTRQGKIIEFIPKFDEVDLKVKIIDRKIIKSEIDFESHKTIVSFGRGIKESPEQNIKLIEGLAYELDGEIGITLPLSKRPFTINQTMDSTYLIPDRVIGTSGSKVAPKLYIAAGISGAMQHIAGMKDSEFIVAINPDEDAPMKNECDVFIKGRMEDVIPILIEEIRKQKQGTQA